MTKKNRERRIPRKAKKFRSQIVSAWLVENYPNMKAADIGGGKGLLSYLLIKNGWNCMVIDPEEQCLPIKFTSLEKKKILIPEEENKLITRIQKPFEEVMAKDFDLLIGLHAHGANMKIINAAKKYNKDFFIIPCCVIDEPIVKEHGINWRESLFKYAQSLGLSVKTVKLGFMGKDIAIYTNRFQSIF